MLFDQNLKNTWQKEINHKNNLSIYILLSEEFGVI